MNPILSERVTDKMPSGLIVVDRQGRIVAHNPASERIFEGTLTRNSRLRDLVREAETLEGLLRRCLEYGEAFTRVEFNVPNQAGIDKLIGINLSPITDSDGMAEGAICLLSDLTEIVELQNQIKLKENFAALGEMSAGIAHEFKNSLATILGYAQMSMHENEIGILHGYAREINKESRALSIMVTDFLNFARPIKASIQEVDLDDLLTRVISDVKNLRPGNYDVSFKATTDAVVTCDSTLIRQTFLNLLINGIEALNDGRGSLTVMIEEAQRGQVRVAVEDTG